MNELNGIVVSFGNYCDYYYYMMTIATHINLYILYAVSTDKYAVFIVRVWFCKHIHSLKEMYLRFFFHPA